LLQPQLIHGGYIEGWAFTPQEILTGLAAALFHDTGLIQTENDLEGTGAKYTVGHEQRSINLMQDYLSKINYPSEGIKDGAAIIHCTILNLPADQIAFRSPEVQTLGKILGTADLLAQMADRNYLEKLVLLFEEFQEAHLPGFDSKDTLYQKTEDFYEFVVKKRFSNDFSSVKTFMSTHFKHRWDLDRDLYVESISKILII